MMDQFFLDHEFPRSRRNDFLSSRDLGGRGVKRTNISIPRLLLRALRNDSKGPFVSLGSQFEGSEMNEMGRSFVSIDDSSSAWRCETQKQKLREIRKREKEWRIYFRGLV